MQLTRRFLTVLFRSVVPHRPFFACFFWFSDMLKAKSLLDIENLLPERNEKRTKLGPLGLSVFFSEKIHRHFSSGLLSSSRTNIKSEKWRCSLVICLLYTTF